MCSFLFTTLFIQNLSYINFYLKFRGPDYTNIYKHYYNEKIYTFIHNLLNITGNINYQPYYGKHDHNENDNSIICIYNGEIYNYKDFGDYDTDGQCIIDCYKKYGDEFISKFDGEFAIVLVDFKKEVIIMSSDIFGKKPIWYSCENNNLSISSYRSSLERLNHINITKIPANTTITLNFQYDIINTKNVYTFDLKQFKTTYDDCIIAFDKAIIKRAKNMKYPIFVCLSSGYDSGAICSALLKNNISFYTYTIISNENMDIVNARIKKNNMPYEIIELTKKDYYDNLEYIKKNAEEAYYVNYPSYSPYKDKNFTKMTDDPAAAGVSHIFSLAKEKNQRIYLSGQGADEIFSDYGFDGKKYIDHSCFGGLYPENLCDIFPKDSTEEAIWYSFYKGTQESYLYKEENISGLHGIEGRYPFLDKDFVQEFLWLVPELKNKKYKSVIDEYMFRNNYPFDNGKKIGFNANKNLI